MNIQKKDNNPGITLVFGDSFIGPLKLFKQPNWIFIKFKGGTMKGLTKEDNENRLVIKNTISRFIKNKKLNAVIFCFGTVDIQFSYYYSKLMNKPFLPEEIIEGYIKFIQSVVNPKKYKVGALLAYPSAISEYNIIYQLEIYHIVDDFYGFPKRDLTVELTLDEREKLINIYKNIRETKRVEVSRILGPDFKIDKRIERLNNFNSIMKRKLKETHIRPIDMGKYLVDSNGMVKKKFIDPSLVNVHFRWEPQIPFMLREFKYYGLTNKYIGNIKKMLANERKYLKEKEDILDRYTGYNNADKTITHTKSKKPTKNTTSKSKKPTKNTTSKSKKPTKNTTSKSKTIKHNKLK